MAALDTIVCHLNNMSSPVWHRLRKVTKAFFILKTMLCNADLSMRTRINEFAKRVQPVASYGSSAWFWSRSLHNELELWENPLLRRIAGIKRKPDKTYVSHVQRSNGIARRFFHRYGQKIQVNLFVELLHRAASVGFVRLCIEADSQHDCDDLPTDFSQYLATVPRLQVMTP